jgi:hypothetical protein
MDFLVMPALDQHLLAVNDAPAAMVVDYLAILIAIRAPDLFAHRLHDRLAPDAIDVDAINRLNPDTIHNCAIHRLNPHPTLLAMIVMTEIDSPIAESAKVAIILPIRLRRARCCRQPRNRRHPSQHQSRQTLALTHARNGPVCG